MNILVTGGAGYVGSIVAEELLKQGHKVIVLDNLQQGHKEAVLSKAEFIVADIRQAEALDTVFRQAKIDAVMHMAAETVVEYSMTDPGRYFQSNIIGGINLLDTMLKYDVFKFIFSSSAAVYGEPQSVSIVEDHSKIPLNAYGESKLMFERILEWYGRAYGLKHISLRYFNAAGASEQLGEDHYPETHLIPNVLKVALLQSPAPNPQCQGLGTRGQGFVSIFGADYPTKDGSCIRDYVHVVDIAQAHILALEKVESPTPSPQSPGAGDQGLGTVAYNLGNGDGYSVLEVVETAKKVTGIDIPVKMCSRRPGDPVVLVANSDRARAELDWQPRFPELGTIIDSAWQWIRQHPEGYGD